MQDNPQLIWSPTYQYLKEKITEQKQLYILISPFIKLDALKSLVEICDDISNLKIVVRWSGRDILSQVTDIEIYPYLKDKAVPLYINPSIHLKLFIFDSNLAFHTSGNITKKGLGLSEDINVEIGCQVRLEFNDWRNIYELLDKSFMVNDDIYNKAKSYLLNNKLTTTAAPPLNLVPTQDKNFSKLSLPATASPDSLYAFYRDFGQHSYALKDTSAFMHDLALYRIPTGLNQQDFFNVLKTNFLSHPFIEEIIKLIRKESPLRFGAINAWITRHCSDKPTPYRWELKMNTRCLYSWLDYFVEAITWDRPSYSMIIYWNEGKE